jgi:hypothetical protein
MMFDQRNDSPRSVDIVIFAVKEEGPARRALLVRRGGLRMRM